MVPTKTDDISDGAMPIFNEIDEQSDRGAAVVGGSFVDAALRLAIEAELHIASKVARDKLFKGYGPIATFSARIELGFALQIFGPKTKADLGIIRTIRNRFAHELHPILFSDPDIAVACDRISLTLQTPIPDNLVSRNITMQRYRYERACKVLVFIFSVRHEELSQPYRDRSSPRPQLPVLP
jgi:DNA-binding MltR family transcriptional regulator